MAIKHLNNQERDLRIADRETEPGNEAAAVLLALQARIERTRRQEAVARAKSRIAHKYTCDCFERGWMAAIAEIEGG